jgi:hypothetical protein
MTDNIPTDINKRLLYFQDEVKKHFSFLSDYNFTLDKTETGRANFLEYYAKFLFKNGDTTLDISFMTDIINGHSTRFPNEKQKPVIDNLVSCTIADSKAFMGVSNFAEAKYPSIPQDSFTIKLNANDINSEITRVVHNYSDFFRDNLTAVLKKEKIYDCYTDRFYDKVFKEITYSK